MALNDLCFKTKWGIKYSIPCDLIHIRVIYLEMKQIFINFGRQTNRNSFRRVMFRLESSQARSNASNALG